MIYKYNTQTKQIIFRISGRSSGGTDKHGHILTAVNHYCSAFNTSGYASILIELEDARLTPKTAGQIVSGYLTAVQRIMRVVRENGGKLDIDVGFVRL